MMRIFFLRRFKFFFLVMMIPILILGTISIIYLENNSRRSIQQSTENTLALVNTSLEMVLSNSTYQYELLTFNPRLILSLEKLLSHDTFSYEDVIFLNSMTTLLRSVSESHPYIDSIYLYLDGYQSLFSTKDGVCSLDDIKDNEWYDTYQDTTTEQRFWIQHRTYQTYKYTKSTDVISLFQRMSNIKGLIVINIDTAQFENSLNSSTSENGEYLYLLNSDFSLLCSNTSGKSIHGDFEDYIASSSSKNTFLNNSNKLLKIGQNQYLCQFYHLEKYDLYFAALIPKQVIFQKSQSTFLLLLGIILSNCIITCFLAYITTFRNFKQIEHIIHTFSNAEQGILESAPITTAKDEYDVILNNIINVFLNSTYLEHLLAEKQYKQELAEMAALQLQINPHFLFNTLQTLDFEALKITGAPTTLNHMFRNLSDILKYSLEDPSDTICLKDELVYLKKYSEIQKMRYGEKFIIYYEIEDTLLDYPVFRLMLQPLIENSISHGISPLEHTGYIKLKVFRRNQFLYFIVLDTGIGLTREETAQLIEHINDEQSKNIGLTNINRRLILHYGIESKLHIQSKKGMGTCISFQIPIDFN